MKDRWGMERETYAHTHRYVYIYIEDYVKKDLLTPIPAVSSGGKLSFSYCLAAFRWRWQNEPQSCGDTMAN